MTGTIPPSSYLLIIGAMKCGTSSLYDYLSGHPQLCAASIKEPEYFSSHQRHGLDVGRYEQLWQFDDRVHRYAMEASTGYTKFPAERGVPERIRDYGLEPKFVYIVRNPLARIVSHYNYMQRDSGFKAGILDDHLLNTSNYFLQLAQFRRLFPARNFLILDFDELKSDPGAVVGQVCRFLGIDETYRPPSYEAANQTQVQSTLERWVKRSPLGGLIHRLPPSLRRSGQRILAALAPRRPRTLSATEKTYILDRLTPDMQRFQQTYGFDITRWGFPGVASPGTGASVTDLRHPGAGT